MPLTALTLARLRQDLAYLRGVAGKAQLLVEAERVPLRAFFTAMLDDLHRLYPEQVPDGHRYLYLQHLAALDSELQAFISTPDYLRAVPNQRQLHQVAVVALEYTLTAVERPA
jgi:hypothetical protein